MKDTVDRITDTIHDVGGTILLTTLTASVAFALGLCSSVPAIKVSECSISVRENDVGIVLVSWSFFSHIYTLLLLWLHSVPCHVCLPNNPNRLFLSSHILHCAHRFR